ncbi:putative N-acetylated-alpha-linked acidic dipeptidase isoform X1 [Actinia tenebrosa]|uniref:N-acetylated-alpha-linked acidic dipeptidase isoform X1 n=1 Tax=Actinia tenebrosa TaxID=6105 RepID=A0A6P8HZ95_ACTTE|nr:putative N-acetylated-alpha-linked acidic dipeptidase isoform X1 [Actinia tenebrosa]
MKGEKVPTSMAGNLPVGYRFGPGFKPNSSNKTLIVKLEVNNQYVTKKIRNVIATISGSEEPDRYVLIGNHKDAVTFGGSDPSSGMAVLMEISRVLWKLKQNGWRPRRTIKLCSWAGKEFEMLGSSEWVEENEDILRDRVVAYLNTDVAIGGNFVLAPQSSTMLGDLILNHAKKFQDPTNSNLTIYDNMFQRMPKYTDYPGEPYVYEFRHFSDTLPFSIFLSLPAADFSYFFGFQIAARLFSLSHSQYDTFYSVKTFADPNFLYCKTMTQFLGSMLLNVSDSVILPFSVRKLAKCVDRAYLSISSPNQLDSLQMNELRQSKDAFSAMVTNFESAKQNIAGQTQNPLKLRALNDQLSGIEKKFSSPYSKTNWPTDKSLLFNCKFWNIKKVMELKNIPESEKRERLKFEMSLMIQKLRAATKFLKPIN